MAITLHKNCIYIFRHRTNNSQFNIKRLQSNSYIFVLFNIFFFFLLNNCYIIIYKVINDNRYYSTNRLQQRIHFKPGVSRYQVMPTFI